MLRRNFLAASLLAGAYPALRAADHPTVAFPSDPRQRLAVSTYPFRSLIKGVARDADGMNKSGISLEEFAQTVSERLNVHGLEPWSKHFESTDSSYVQGLAAAFSRAGLRVVNISVDLPVHLCGSDARQMTDGLDQYRKWVDAAVILKSPGIRVHVPAGPERQTDLQCALQSLGQLAKYGAEKKVVINLENDDPKTEDPFTIVEILKSINSPYLRALPDFCNSMLIADDPEYNNRGLTALFKYAYSISHVKDSESDRGKLYNVDMHEIFEIAKRARYKGYFSMEWEGTGDPYQGTAALIRKSLESLG
jgi:sugar phosphate isomerase/epimerase